MEFLKTLKGLITLGIVVFGIGMLFMYWFKSEPQILSTPAPVHAPAKVNKQLEAKKDVDKHKQNIVEKALGTKKVAQPIEVSTASPEPSPIKKEYLVVLPTEAKKETVYIFDYNYDFIIYGDVGRRDITLTTFNPLLKAKNDANLKAGLAGVDYVTSFKFNRDGENFLFSSVKDSTSGVKLVWNDSPIKWRGWRIGGAFGQPDDWYLFFGARVEIYSIGIETQIRAHGTPMWISVDYRF